MADSQGAGAGGEAGTGNSGADGGGSGVGCMGVTQRSNRKGVTRAAEASAPCSRLAAVSANACLDAAASSRRVERLNRESAALERAGF